MRIWLVTVGEPLPTDGPGVRLYRAGMLSRQLVQRGHDVTWWTSSFNHTDKRHRLPRRDIVEVTPGFRLMFLHGCSYSGNLSVRRLANHWQEAREFRSKAGRLDPPDLILASYPTIDLALEVVRFARSREVPAVLDVRDLWPDIFLEAVPRPLRWLGLGPTALLDSRARSAFSSAAGISGTSESFVEWGLEKAGRARGICERAFPLAYSASPVSERDRDTAEAFWRGQALPEAESARLVCFFGNFSRHVLDLKTVLKAARLLEGGPEGIGFVLCGRGPIWEQIRRRAAGRNNIWLPGHVGAAEIRTLMERSIGGLVPYAPRWDFERSFPNKALEYLSAGLPVVTSLTGELAALVQGERCGVTYRNGRADALAEALVALARDDAARRSLGANAARVFRERFAAEVVYRRFAEHLENVALNWASVHSARSEARRESSVLRG